LNLSSSCTLHLNLCTLVFTSYTSIIANLTPLPHLFHILLYTPFFFCLSRTPVLILCYEHPLIFTNLAPLPHLFHVYFMHSHIYFAHPACLLYEPPISYNSHPLCLCFSFLGLCLCITRCTSHITHAPYYCCFFYFYLFVISFFFFFFFKKRENENILNYKKLQKIEKFKKRKIFFLALLCLSDRPYGVTLIFKITKNTFLSLLVSVRPLASYDTYFQVIQKKHQKIQNFQNIKISTF